MAVGVFTVLALEQSFVVIVPAADVARLVHWVLEVLVGNYFRHKHCSLAFNDLVICSTAVRAFGGESTALHDAGETIEMAAAQASYLPLLDLSEIR